MFCLKMEEEKELNKWRYYVVLAGFAGHTARKIICFCAKGGVWGRVVAGGLLEFG